MARQEPRTRQLLAECADEGLCKSNDLWPRIYTRALAARPMRRRRAIYNTALGLAGALLLIALIAQAPAVRSTAERIRLALAGPTQPPEIVMTPETVVPFISGSPGEPTPIPLQTFSLMSLAEIEQRAPFRLRTPAWLPEGIEPAGGSIDGSGDATQIILEYQWAGRPDPAPLRQWISVAAPTSPPLPPAEQRAPTQVAGLPAAYARGGWDIADPDAPRWDSSLDSTWLIWQEDGLTYVLEAHILDLSLGNLVRIAESLAQ